jgi:CMP-N-acetylneuraminic acid synthetase
MKMSNTPAKVVALVPMRHNSERVPGKNYRQFAGCPLYHHIISNLLACPLITEVVIDTDSRKIMEDASQHFPQVRLIERPEHLKAGTIPMNDVLLYDVTQTESVYYLQTHSTNPLLCTETISKAIETFLYSGDHDSLYGVTRLQTRLYDAQGNPINHDPDILLRTQDLPPVYEENSTIYIFSRETLEVRKNRIGRRPIMFEVNRDEATDIDEESDFIFAEFLFKQRHKMETNQLEIYGIDNGSIYATSTK